MPAGVALILALLLAMVASAAVFVGCYLTLARWARVKIDKVSLGYGPALFTRVIAGTPVSFSLVPIAASATVRGMNPYEETVEAPEPPLLLWRDAPLGRRIGALILGPRFAAALLAIAFLGPRSFGAAFVSGIIDFPAALYCPLPVLDRAAERYATEGFVALIAVALVKVLAIGCYQLPFDLLRGKGSAKISALVLLVVFAVAIGWLAGFVRWCLRG